MYVREERLKDQEHHREGGYFCCGLSRGSENLWNFCQLLIKSRKLLSWKKIVLLLYGSGLVQQMEDM